MKALGVVDRYDGCACACNSTLKAVLRASACRILRVLRAKLWRSDL